MIFVNFKTYQKGAGEKAISLSQIVSTLANQSGVEIIACPQATDLIASIKKSEHPVWAQHVDAKPRGKTTGWFPPEVAIEVGAKGSLLNHSEHKLTVGVLAETLKRCKEVGLKTLVFADSLKEAKIVAEFKPDFIGYEPPELVGSKTTSVTSAKPEVIKEVVEAITPIPLIVGAGIHSREDVEKSLELGAQGIAVATDVVLADDPEKELKDLVEGFKK